MRTEGGVAFFPGLARPTVIDLGTLSPADEARMRDLVAAALAAPPAPPPPKGAADYRTTFLSIEDGGDVHQLAISDVDTDPSRRALLDALGELRRAMSRR